MTMRPGIEERHQAGQHLPDPSARVTDQLDGDWTRQAATRADRRPRRAASPCSAEHLGERLRAPGSRRGGRVAGEGRASGERLEAAGVAARTGWAQVVDTDVTDVPGAAVHAAVELAVDDDPAADARPDLHEEEVAGVASDASAGALFADGEHVDVVVEDYRAAQVTGHARLRDSRPSRA